MNYSVQLFQRVLLHNYDLFIFFIREGDACSSQFRPRNVSAAYGTLTSPNYPSNYPNNAECQWFITAPLGANWVSVI